MNDAIRERTIKIIKASKETAAARGWSPTGSAAAAIYIATISSGESVEEKELPEVAGTAPITIRKRYKELETRFQLTKYDLSPLTENGVFFALSII